jgi:hypothetical protein
MANDWTIGLEQRSDLSIVSGRMDIVADTVRRGADLRLYMTTETYEETLYFQQTYAGEGENFAGLMSHHHSYNHRGGPAPQPYVSFFKYDAFGAYSHVKWMLDNSVLNESQAYPYGVYRWFHCDRWRTVYENDDQGRCIDGDLDELQEMVRQGRSIRVGIRRLFGLAEDRIDGPDHISFVETMQPVIQDGCVLSNCDFVLVGAPVWPIEWSNGLHVAMMQPSTSGQIVCYLAEPGRLPFTRFVRRRAMQWMAADRV